MSPLLLALGSTRDPGAAPGVERQPIDVRLAHDPLAAPSMLHVVHLSFEGPDPYAHAGGLAVRVTTMARALAALGHDVDLYFVGDPDGPGQEFSHGVRLNRWSQHLSARAPGGVYDGEEAKVADWCTSLPAHLADVVADDAAAGRRTVILAEDWHTAWPLICLHDELVRRGLRHHPILAWTANNRFGFERIDFERLSAAARVLTISRAMKHLMWRYGVNPRVVPNGLDACWSEPAGGAGPDQSRRIRRALPGRMVLTKVGRWDPDKRWLMALHAVADLADDGRPAVLLARGWNGSPAAKAHAGELQAAARARRLPWITVDAPGASVAGSDSCSGAGTSDTSAVALADALSGAGVEGSAVVELAFPVTGSALATLYRSADAVLANSGFEPFGLVGLEAMAAGAIVITGSTGEDYLRPFHNGFALDTDDPAEIVACLDWVERDPSRSRSLRSAARRTAAGYTWPAVIERLLLALGTAEVIDPTARCRAQSS